jgi:hypothetical protein
MDQYRATIIDIVVVSDESSRPAVVDEATASP